MIKTTATLQRTYPPEIYIPGTKIQVNATSSAAEGNTVVQQGLRVLGVDAETFFVVEQAAFEQAPQNANPQPKAKPPRPQVTVTETPTAIAAAPVNLGLRYWIARATEELDLLFAQRLLDHGPGALPPGDQIASKDLVLEMAPDATYAVNPAGAPIELEFALRHE